MKKKKVCIITGSRAEWGLLYPLAREIKADRGGLSLSVIATGAHLAKNFGMTYKEIEEDGFRIDKKVKIPLKLDTEEAIANSISRGITGFAGALKILKPDIVILLGDRFEIFAAAVACLFLRVPVCHIHGGELTKGSLDDALRHSITKIAHYHFVSTDVYRKRVIQMGEEPSRVFNVGAMGIDNIKNTKMLDRRGFERRTGVKLGARNVLVTFNPATAEDISSQERQLLNLLEVLDGLKDTRIIFTKPNPDICSKRISALIDEYACERPDKCFVFGSMGRILYLSALRLMDAVAGNSSSGIIEVPSFGIPTINIGSRQEGRVKASSVIDTDGSLEGVRGAFRKAFSKGFKESCRKGRDVYGAGDASKKIVRILKKIDKVPAGKNFYDIEFKINNIGDGKR